MAQAEAAEELEVQLPKWVKVGLETQLDSVDLPRKPSSDGTHRGMLGSRKQKVGTMRIIPLRCALND